MEVYLDNNATSPISEKVAEAIKDSFAYYANPSSVHSLGIRVRNFMDDARNKVALALGVSKEEIIFTSGGTESDNLAILGSLKKTSKKHIVTSLVEHHAVLNLFKQLEKEGYEVTYLPVDKDGIVDLDSLSDCLRPDTALVSIMYANNETGAIQPIEKAVQIVKNMSEKIIFHTDAVQAFGKLPLSLRSIPIDMASVSAHKINGPKGVGALYVRKGLKIMPLFRGGHHEYGMRPGTENIMGIAGFGAASDEAVENLSSSIEKYTFLKKRLWEGIYKTIPRVLLNGGLDKTLPNTLNVSFTNIEGESIIIMLDLEGIAVSSGSACTSGSLESSHVLSAMGVPAAAAQGSIRFSFGRYNTEEEVDYVLEKLPPIVSRLRAMSPLEK
ncbi:MAG: IscS subfamily cysteine desulfurase [Elusimicrobia bacterium]|nr:IscS subfamily cysteine desulfurase [Elusimicrobiota bacterium]